MRIIYLVFILIILTTCTKFGENIYIKGKVVNPATGKGIPNVEIALQKRTTFEFSTGYKAVETVTTDANGEFEIRHLGGLKQYYLNCMYSSSFYPLGWTVNGVFKKDYITTIKKGKKNEVEFQMLPFCYLKKKISNVNCFNSNDYIEIWERHLIVNDYFLDLPAKKLLGCTTFVSNDYKTILMGNIEFTWYVTKNEIKTTFKDTIFIGENEQKTYEINY